MDDLKCSAGFNIVRIQAAAGKRTIAMHDGGGRCEHQIARGGVLIYDGRPELETLITAAGLDITPWQRRILAAVLDHNGPLSLAVPYHDGLAVLRAREAIERMREPGAVNHGQ
jgi:hypothetical protein